MPKHNTKTEISAKGQQTLAELRVRIRGSTFARDVWHRLLTSSDRKQLGGDLESAWKKYRSIVKIWMEVRGVSEPRAIVDVAYGIGLLATAHRDWLLKEIGEEVQPKAKAKAIVPGWEPDTGKLFYRGRQIRQIRSMQRTNVKEILNWFEERGWPRSIELPQKWPQDTVHQAIRSLNKGLRAIRFHSRNGGRTIYWSRSKSQ